MTRPRPASPFGHRWILARHLEDISAEEMQRRTDEFMASAAA